MKSFLSWAFPFTDFFRLLSLYNFGLKIFIRPVGKLQKFFGFSDCGSVFLNTQERNLS